MDPRLVEQARGGSEVAFAAIAQEVHVRQKQTAYRILRDRHLADDAVQLALVELWRDLPQLRDVARFEAWSYRILVNACYREAKQHRRWLRRVPSREDRVGTDETTAVNDRDQLERGFAGLSLDHRTVLVLHYYLDLTIEDTASALGVSAGTAKSRLNRAMKRLRTALGAEVPARSASKAESAR